MIMLINGDDTEIVISFVDGVITLNTEGRGEKTSMVGTEVIING